MTMTDDAGWGDPGAALDMRNLVEDIAQQVYDSNQIFRRAVTKTIAADGSAITVSFVDEPTVEFSVFVTFLRPTGVGQQVEIEVRNGNEFYINRVYGESIITETGNTSAPSQPVTVVVTGGIRQLVVTWDPVAGADYYLVERSQLSTFASGLVTQVAESNILVINGLIEGNTWYIRVTGYNVNGLSPVSATVIGVVQGELPASDSLVPSNSPPTSVVEGLGFLQAQWPAQANTDPVTYEVHISTVSGFAISAATKVAETESTFAFINTLPNRTTKLSYGVTYFVRVLAKDIDGAATVAGAQGFGAPRKVELGDAGNISSTSIRSDGAIPSMSGVAVLSSGIGYLYARWTAATSVDSITYDVHISAVNGFAPDANSLSLTTTSLFGFIRKQGPGAASADLVYGTTYYVRVVARDADGSSAASAQSSGFTVQVGAPDITLGTITATSGIIANLAITTAHIADVAITRAKIGTLAVGTAQIEDLSVTSAKVGSLAASKITTDLLSATLTITGMIRTSAATARVQMDGTGLFAVDTLGNETFRLNSGTGSLSLKGSILAGSSITG